MKKVILFIMCLLICICGIMFSIGSKSGTNKLVPFNSGDLYGYIDTGFKMRVEPKYVSASNFFGGYAIVEETTGKPYILNEKLKKKYIKNATEIVHVWGDIFSYTAEGVISVIRLRDKKILAEDLWRHATSKGEDTICISGNINNTDYINFDGALLFTYPEKGFSMKEQRAIIGDVKYGFDVVDKTGTVLNKEKFEVLSQYFSEGLVSVKMSDGRTGYMDKNATLVLDVPFYTEYGPRGLDGGARPFINGYAFVKMEKEPSSWYVIDKEGNFVTDKLPYQFMEYSYEGYSVIRNYYTDINNSRYSKDGFIRYDGTILANTIFDKAASFHNGFAQIVYEEKDGLIDTKGNIYWSEDLLNDKIMPIHVDLLN